MNTEKTSTEDKFFGVAHEIDTEAEAPEVVVEDEETKPEVKAEEKDEVETYSEKVQKRIDKLTYERHEADRQRQNADKMREEAIRFAQTVAQKNQQYESIISNGEARLVETIKGRAELAVKAAKDRSRKAHEEGNTEEVVAAQEDLIRAEAESREAQNYGQDFANRQAQHQAFLQQRAFQAQQQQRMQQMAPQQAQPPRATEKATQWGQKNTWFGKNKDMTALAYGVHERLVTEEGIVPDTDEYFAEIDKVIHSKFPEHFEKESHRPNTVVASAGRNNGAKPRTVKLTPTAAAVAKKLGLTYEQYAAAMTQEDANV